MKSVRGFVLFPLGLILGCALPPSAPSTPANPWQNWQIQAGSAITSPPNSYPSFIGAIQTQGTQVSGIFIPITSTGSGTALEFGGALNASTNDVTLSTYGYGFGLTPPSTPYTLTPVGVIGGCVYPPNYPGAECLAIFSVPSTGVQIADLTGTYTGTLANSATPSMSGTATLTLAQSATPDANGAFPLAATIVFPASSDLGTDPLTGTVSGEGLTLNYCSPAVIGPCISISGSTNPAATQLTISNMAFSDPGTNTFSSFTGTLNRQ